MLRKTFLKISAQVVAGSILLNGCKKSGDMISPNSGANLIQQDQKIGFFGDSITFGGRYIEILRKKIKNIDKYKKVSLENFGKSSETVSGLSEAIHDPRRPVLFDRLDEIYDENKPDFLFFWYGINDAIYHPFSSERFSAYSNGVARFLDFARNKGHKVVLMTPGPFGISNEARNFLQKKGNVEYSWMNPYPRYNQVMKQYKDYILSIDHPNVVKKIDLHRALSGHKGIAFDEDPIHPNEKGHQIIAEEIFKAVF